jgi:hypothetical protein
MDIKEIEKELKKRQKEEKEQKDKKTENLKNGNKKFRAKKNQEKTKDKEELENYLLITIQSEYKKLYSKDLILKAITECKETSNYLKRLLIHNILEIRYKPLIGGNIDKDKYIDLVSHYLTFTEINLKITFNKIITEAGK